MDDNKQVNLIKKADQKIVHWWILKEKVLLERFLIYCTTSNGLVSNSDDVWQSLFIEWKKSHKERK